ncbi:zinc finger protein 414 [Anableps anableps]
MSPSDTAMQASKNGDGALGTRRLPCPMHGCKRVYTEMSALESHVMDHDSPAQSLPGKKLLCSTGGCSASFPSMQKLMEHTRHHYKPNIYFQCESCRTKLRSYRGLLAHLHTCSKVPRPKPKAAEPAAPLLAAVAASNMTPKTSDLAPPQLESVSPQQVPIQTTSVPSAVPLPDSADPPMLGPPMLTLQELPPPPHVAPKLTEAPPQPPFGDAASQLAASFRPIAPKAAADPPSEVPIRSPGAVHAAPGSAAYTPSAAVWRKNQAMSSHRRVLWEHTRGRYTCVQCGHTLTNRKEMTQHINSQHHGNKSGEDAGSSVTKS